MSLHRPTPRLSQHARDRAAEMGVTTKVVKKIVRDPHTDYVTYADRRIASRNDYPEIRVVYRPDDPPLVVTVVWNTPEVYTRPEKEAHG